MEWKIQWNFFELESIRETKQLNSLWPITENFFWDNKDNEVKLRKNFGLLFRFLDHNSFPENSVFEGEKKWIFGLEWEKWRNNVIFSRVFQKWKFLSRFFSNFAFMFSYLAAIVFSFWTVSPRDFCLHVLHMIYYRIF